MMSGNNGWRLSSSLQSNYHVQQTDYFPFLCCWCHQSFMDIEALITHHEAHLILRQDQVQTYYSTTFFRPQSRGNLAMNPPPPFRSLLPMAASSSNSVVVQPAGQFSLPYNQQPAVAGGSLVTQSHLSLLRGVNGLRQQRGIDKWLPLSVTSRLHPTRPNSQRQGMINEVRAFRAARSQRDQMQTPRPSGVVTMPLIDHFGHPETTADQNEEGSNEALDLTLSLKTPFN